MAIAFRSAGAIAANATTTSMNVAAPVDVANNDILICVVLGKDNLVASFPVGWTKFVEQDNTTAQRMTVAWRRWATGDPTTFAVTKPTDNNLLYCAVIAAFSGCIASGTPIGVTATPSPNASSATVTANGLTPGASTEEVCFAGVYNNDLTTFTTAGGTNPTFVKNVDVETATGTDGSLFLQNGSSGNGAATGTRTCDSGAAAVINVGVLFTLIPTGETEVTERAAATTTLEAAATTRTAGLSSLEATGTVRGALLISLEATETSRSAALAILEAAATARSALLTGLEAVAQERAALAILLEATAVERAALLATLTSAASERLAQLATLDKIATERLVALATLEAGEVSRAAALASLTYLGEQRSALVTTLDAITVERTASIATLDATATGRAASLALLNATESVRAASLATLDAIAEARMAAAASLDATTFARVAGIVAFEAITLARVAGHALLESETFARTGLAAALNFETSARIAGLIDLAKTAIDRVSWNATLQAPNALVSTVIGSGGRPHAARAEDVVVPTGLSVFAHGVSAKPHFCLLSLKEAHPDDGGDCYIVSYDETQVVVRNTHSVSLKADFIFFHLHSIIQ